MAILRQYKYPQVEALASLPTPLFLCFEIIYTIPTFIDKPSFIFYNQNSKSTLEIRGEIMNRIASLEMKMVDDCSFKFFREKGGLPPHWESLGIDPVFIFPPHKQGDRWDIWFPSSAIHANPHEDRSEEYVFSIAAGIIKASIIRLQKATLN